MTRSILLICFICLFFNLKAQDFFVEAKTLIDGKFIITGGEEVEYDIDKGIELEINTLILTHETIDFFAGISFVGNTIPPHLDGKYKIASGVLEAEADFLSNFLFQHKDYKVTLFSTFKPGIGKYKNDFYDDVHFSLGLDWGFKFKYKDFFLCFLKSKTKSIQEPGGGESDYQQKSIGVSFGKAF